MEVSRSLREEFEYCVDGEITEADRREEDGRVFDRIQFRFDLKESDGRAAASTVVTWHYGRSQS